MLTGLDIDGVVADFIPRFLQVVEKEVGNGPIPVETIRDLSFKEHPHLSEKIVSDCMEKVSYDPDFWQNLSPLLSRTQWDALEVLNRRGELVFVTHRYQRETYDIHQVTCEWLQRYGVTNPRVYFTQDTKSTLVGKLGIGLFVDDRHENCQDVAEKTEALVLMPHRHYNQSFSHPRVKRIQNLDEMFSYVP